MKTNNVLQVGGRYIFSAILIFLVLNTSATDWLFRGGKSSYRIVVSAEASTSEKTAARELQQYIEQISGVQLPVVTDLKASGRSIYVGYNSRVAALTGAPKPETNDESFTYRTVGHNLCSSYAVGYSKTPNPLIAVSIRST